MRVPQRSQPGGHPTGAAPLCGALGLGLPVPVSGLLFLVPRGTCSLRVHLRMRAFGRGRRWEEGSLPSPGSCLGICSSPGGLPTGSLTSGLGNPVFRVSDRLRGRPLPGLALAACLLPSDLLPTPLLLSQINSSPVWEPSLLVLTGTPPGARTSFLNS